MSTKESYASDAEFEERDSASADSGLTEQELAFLAGTNPEIIRQLADLDLIVPAERSPTLLFKVETIPMVRKILRLRRHLQISFDSMALIFDLLERIDALEKQCGMQTSE